MATLMEKDIVMEAISGVGALICRKVEVEMYFNEDQTALHKMHFKFSRQKPEEINFREVIDYCQALRKKYDPMPDNQFHQKMAREYEQRQADAARS
jgi:hypothetical protein